MKMSLYLLLVEFLETPSSKCCTCAFAVASLFFRNTVTLNCLNPFQIWDPLPWMSLYQTELQSEDKTIPRAPSTLEVEYDGESKSIIQFRKRLPATWGKVVVFARYSGFLHQLKLASHDLASIWQRKWRKTKFQIPVSRLDVILTEW